MRKIIWICFLFLSFSLMAQENLSVKTVEGRIVDARGEPLIGVTIKEKDGKAYSVSDLDGNFVIALPQDAGKSLLVSYIGYKTQEVKVDNHASVRLVLQEDAMELDEMVVIGYGTQKKASLTSSIETIKSEELMKMPTPNLDQALAGQVAGLNVMSSTGDPTGREASLSVRGIVGEPLLVIDGVPRFGTTTADNQTRLSDINPDDVESISILKDGAAAAIYGARAARGIILVTTKRGKGDKKIRINYRGQYNLQKATRFPEFLEADEFIPLRDRALANSPDFEGKFTFQDGGNENLLNYLKDYGYSTTHSLSLSGGDQDITYYVSGGYTNIQGLYSGVGRDRYNYSAKLDAKLSSNLRLSVDLLGSRSENKNTSYGTIDAAYNFSPTQVLRYPDGKLASLDSSNPLIALEGLGGYTQNKADMSTLIATLRYDIPWVKGLSVYAKGTFDNNSFDTKTYKKPVTLYLKDKDTGLISEDPKTVSPTATISLTKSAQSTDNRIIEAGLNYTRRLQEVHHIEGLLVTSYQRTSFQLLSATNNDLEGIYPELMGKGVEGTINDDEVDTEIASVVGRVSYNYDYRYFVEGNFRLDGSTKFHPDHRWDFFPSISTAWLISNEAFFKSWRQNVISNLKLRASTGLLGDDGGVQSFSYQMKYIFSQQSGYSFGDSKNKQGLIPSVEPWPNLEVKMEQRRDYNLAGDFGFWDNRFGLTYEYYWRYRTNMIDAIPAYLYAPSAGVGGRYPYVNIGKVKEWGWDLTLNHRNTIGQVKYNVDLTLSKMDNEVLDWGDESTQSLHRQRKGKAYMTWSLFEADGLFQSWEEIEKYPIDQDGNGNASIAPGDIKYKDQNGDNEITSEDRVYVKNSSYPDYSFSVKLGASYKGFFFNMMLQGVAGYQQQINEMYSLYNNSLPRFQAYHRDNSWTEENPGARYPRVTFSTTNSNNRRASTFWVEDCDFVRLKSLSFGYHLPVSYLRKLKLASATVSLQGGNLFTWSSLGGIDPESLRGYPIQRTYGASLSLGF